MTRNRRKKRENYFTFLDGSFREIADVIYNEVFNQQLDDLFFKKKNNKVKFKYVTRKGNGV